MFSINSVISKVQSSQDRFVITIVEAFIVFLFALKHDIDAIIMLNISILWNKIFFFILNDICNFLLMDKFNKYLTCLN